MTILGYLCVKDFLENTQGQVRGTIVTDGKNRFFSSNYKWEEVSSDYIQISKLNGTGDSIRVLNNIPLDESLISFFGLYSGDGSKGSEDANDSSKIRPAISFSQREPNLVKFAIMQFRRIFGDSIRFTFSLGEDSAFFINGEGMKLLLRFYSGNLPEVRDLSEIHPDLNKADIKYLRETRPVAGTNEMHLAFYYTFKNAMEKILIDVKNADINRVGIDLQPNDHVTASLRRPFKKGARQPGGSSRSDELHVGGLNGIGELFLKMLYDIEQSIQENTQSSNQGLVRWNGLPSDIGEIINLKTFFESNPYGAINDRRPEIQLEGVYLKGKWKASKLITLAPSIRIDPLWCYTSGLYLAEGSTTKSILFSMYNIQPTKLSLAFTSSENASIELVLRSLRKLFLKDDCLSAWKIKVGSQYFPELVVIGLKEGVPMLRGGESGDGKLRTMEISLSLKNWALSLAPSLFDYADKYSHVEPTGAGLPRIDFWCSSALCKWYFPLILFATFGHEFSNPKRDFL